MKIQVGNKSKNQYGIFLRISQRNKGKWIPLAEARGTIDGQQVFAFRGEEFLVEGDVALDGLSVMYETLTRGEQFRCSPQFWGDFLSLIWGGEKTDPLLWEGIRPLQREV